MVDTRALGDAAFKEGKNVAQTLRAELGVDHNTAEIIEIAYELQAGSYIQFANENPDFVSSYAAQLARLLDPQLEAQDRLLDVGAGELTILSHVVRNLATPLSAVVACDISETRLRLGREYAEQHMGPASATLETFKADISSLPLPDKAVDVVTSNHALEPNGGREVEILTELLRVARRKLVLFEPCYEIASPAARQRMEAHAYIQGLGAAAEAAGGRLESVQPLELVARPENPTAAFVILAS